MTDSLHPHPEVVTRAVGTGAVLVHLPSNHVFELNETGRAIWEALASGTDAAEIPHLLSDRFDVSADEARRATEKLCSQLTDLGLLV